MTAKHHVARIASVFASVLAALAVAAPAFADPPSLWKDEPPAAATHPDNGPRLVTPAATSGTDTPGALQPVLVGLLLVGVGIVALAAVVRRTTRRDERQPLDPATLTFAREPQIAGRGEES